jgi:hypothetical protein
MVNLTFRLFYCRDRDTYESSGRISTWRATPGRKETLSFVGSILSSPPENGMPINPKLSPTTPLMHDRLKEHLSIRGYCSLLFAKLLVVKAVSTANASVASCLFCSTNFLLYFRVDLNAARRPAEKNLQKPHAHGRSEHLFRNQRSSNASFARVTNPTYLNCIRHSNILYVPIGFKPYEFSRLYPTYLKQWFYVTI